MTGDIRVTSWECPAGHILMASAWHTADETEDHVAEEQAKMMVRLGIAECCGICGREPHPHHRDTPWETDEEAREHMDRMYKQQQALFGWAQQQQARRN